MTIGIPKTLETMKTVQDLAVRLIQVAKAPTILAFFAQAPAIFADVRIIADDAPLVVPELQDLDAQEVGQLGTAAYQLVTAVVQALNAKS